MIFKYGPIEGIKLKGLPGSMGWKEKLSGSWSGGSCPAQKFGTSFSKHRHRSQFVGYLPMVIPDNWSSHPPWFPFGFGPPVGGAQTTGPSQHLQALRCLEQLDHYDTMMASWKALSMDLVWGKIYRKPADVHHFWDLKNPIRSKDCQEPNISWNPSCLSSDFPLEINCVAKKWAFGCDTEISVERIDPLRKSLRMMTTFSWSWRLGSRGGFEFTNWHGRNIPLLSTQDFHIRYLLSRISTVFQQTTNPSIYPSAINETWQYQWKIPIGFDGSHYSIFPLIKSSFYDGKIIRINHHILP